VFPAEYARALGELYAKREAARPAAKATQKEAA